MKPKISFNLGLEKETAEKISNYTIVDEDGNPLTILTVLMDETSNRLIYIDIDNPGNEVKHYLIVSPKVTPISGKTISPDNRSEILGLGQDVTSVPILLEINTAFNPPDRIELIFSKSIEPSSALNISNYSITPSSGSIPTPNISSINQENGQSRIMLIFNQNLESFSMYNISAVNLEDLYGNEAGQIYATIQSPDTTPPILTILNPNEGDLIWLNNLDNIYIQGLLSDNDAVNSIEICFNGGDWKTFNVVSPFSYPLSEE